MILALMRLSFLPILMYENISLDTLWAYAVLATYDFIHLYEKNIVLIAICIIFAPILFLNRKEK